ncbi:MAG: SemiSWEET transporter [Candidatus Kapaibacterium sp.]
MDIVMIIGFCAAICTTIAFVPQAIMTWRTRQTRDISLPMYIIFTLGVICWLIYGIMLNALPIILANIVTLALALSILILKLKHG